MAAFMTETPCNRPPDKTPPSRTPTQQATTRSVKSTDFYNLVSGRRRGLSATVLRGLLALAEGPYRVGVWWRNRRYDTKPELTTTVEVPVVSVGNLTLGGTGKTPMVKWVARQLRERGGRVTLVSRGYGSHDGGPNDEALELEQALPDVPHVQNPDRIAAARVAIDELAAQTLVLDDGFQHRRLARDLDIVLLDATEPFGYGRVFPRGALREGVRSLGRAGVVCLTRSDLIDSIARREIRDRVHTVAPDALWCESIARPQRLLGVNAQSPIESLAGKRIAAFCGIGNPDAFRTTLAGLGAEVVELVEFADHHAYRRADIEQLHQRVEAAGAEMVLCTHKDLVKVGLEELAGRPLFALEIAAEITVGEQALLNKLDRLAEAALAIEWAEAEFDADFPIVPPGPSEA